jgi:hypothetical protein
MWTEHKTCTGTVKDTESNVHYGKRSNFKLSEEAEVKY